jgi:hypothetical protein
MEGQAMLGRGIAAVGIVLGLVAIWVSYGDENLANAKYWDDGTLGGLLLILAVLAAVALAGAISTGRRDFDLAVGALGGVAFGLYLFLPAVFAFDQWKFLDVGAWLGLCSALTLIGASIATWPSDRAVARRPSAVGILLALVGLGLIVAGLFPDVESGGSGSYWSLTGTGHSFGVLMIVLAVLVALSIAAAYSMAAGMDSAILLGAVTLGAALTVPVSEAFNNLGRLRAGAWLVAIGGIVLAVGILAMWQLARSEVPVAAPAPPPA